MGTLTLRECVVTSVVLVTWMLENCRTREPAYPSRIIFVSHTSGGAGPGGGKPSERFALAPTRVL